MTNPIDLAPLVLGLIEDMPRGLVVVDEEGRCLLSNSLAEQLLGGSPAGVPLGDWPARFALRRAEDHRDPLPAAELPLARALSGETLEVDIRQVFPTRQSGRWLRFAARPLRDPKGAVTGAVMLLRDATERRRKKILLAGRDQILKRMAAGFPLDRSLVKLLRSLDESFEGAMSLIRLPGNLGGARTLAAVEAPAALACIVDHVVPLWGAAGRVSFSGTLQGVVAENLHTDPRWSSVRSDVEKLRVRSCWCAPIVAAGGIGIGILAVFFPEARGPSGSVLEDLRSCTRVAGLLIEGRMSRDAIEDNRRRLLQALSELRSAQSQLVRKERLHALGQMASGIAHDFMNALSPILGFSELLLLRAENMADPAKLRRYIESIRTSALDAADVVRRLREFYRHREESERFDPVLLNDVVREVIVLTQPIWKEEAQAKGRIVRVMTDLEAVPAVPAQPAEMREVLTNLILNALDAMPQGGEIRLRTREGPDSVVLEVCDSGSGMTEEVRRKCLEPFFSTKGDRGTGLGLSIVFGIVKRHRGTIDIDSRPGKGTTIRISLPITDETKAPRPADECPTEARAFRVLAVDDDPLVCEVIREYLLGEGHEVETVLRGRAAIEKLRTEKFDVLVTDRSMPGMSGDDVAKAAKGLDPDIYVVLLTGFGDLMKAAGEKPPFIDHILGKPVTLADLLGALPGGPPART